MAEEVAHPRTVRLLAGGGVAYAPPLSTARTASEALRPGVIVGGYELVRPIGKGAVGSVFLARDLKLGRRVAIKFLISTDSTVTRRFLVEAQATARCIHENIVVIHEVGSWQGIPFMVLEYLDGPALSALLSTSPLSLSRALELIVPVVRALGCAHRADIVHRDLKPDNIIVTRTGAVKVVDFGIAKLFHRDSVDASRDGDDLATPYETISGPGLVIGTLAYMAPEQWRGLDVDARCDLFAVGVILFRMLTSAHPSGGFTPRGLRDMALAPHSYPSVASAGPALPASVVRIVDRCLRKHPADRYASAEELLADLEALANPSRPSSPLEECPYLGLSQFTAHDAARFFGRGREVTAALALLRRTPVLSVVGPSGSGKSSLVLAGIAPALRSSMSDYEIVTLRPGRAPLFALLDAVGHLTGAVAGQISEARLRAEPGVLGVALREYCHARGTSLLVIVDQFEEVFTLAHHDEVRRVFVDALLAAADDVSSPVRLALTLRSDFLHRVAEHPWLTEVVGEGMLLLTPPDLTTLRAALVSPLGLVDYAFEDDELVEEIVQGLASSSVPLPLLQLVGTRLWSHRDRKRGCLSRHSYHQIGGVSGALAGQADDVLAGLSSSGRKLVRSMLLRLVTSQGTRAVVDRADLLAMSPEASAVLASLVHARLVVVNEDDGSAELIHEALIEQWPALRSWIQESREDFALRDRLMGAARQWAEAGRPSGQLWTGEALDHIKAALAHDLPLGARERDFVKASAALASRAARRRRLLVTSALVTLATVAGLAIIALAAVQRAQGQAQHQATIAEGEAQRARAAERSLSEKIVQLESKERQRIAAEQAAAASQEIAEQRRGEVARSQGELEVALGEAEEAQRRAEAAAKHARELATQERALRDNLAEALARERKRVEELRQQRSKIEQSLQ